MAAFPVSEKDHAHDNPARQIGANAGLIAQFHADVDCVGDHLDFLAVAKTPANVGGCRSGGQADGFVRLDEFSRSQANATFFRREPLLASKKRAVVTKWLVEKWLNQLCSAMRSTNQAPVFEARQVPPNTGSR